MQPAQETNRALENFLASVERQAFLMARVATDSREEALDIVQDSMLGLVKKYGKNAETEWRQLFFRILQSRIRDWYRRQAVRKRWRVWFSFSPGEKDEDDDPVSRVEDPRRSDPEKELLRAAATARLAKALRSLPLRQQQTFMLRAWQGMSVAETAQVMNCAEGSVKTHYARALGSLRKELEAYWP